MQSSPLKPHFAIRNVTVWNHNSILENQDVLVSGGKIEAIVPTGSRKTPDQIIDGSGLVLIPSGIDVQAHLRVPGQPEKETPLSGLRAALRGGYAAVLTMPNTQPVIDNPEVLEKARREITPAKKETGVEVLWSAAVTIGQKGEKLADLSALEEAGVAAFTDDGKGVAPDGLMAEAFARLEKLGRPFLQHAEMPGHGGVLAPGPVQEKMGVKAYHADAEWKMVERDLSLLKKYPRARYHVLHVSAKETIELVKKAKSSGLHVTAEVSPHHLHFSTEDISPRDSSFKMNPPIRGPEDRQALIRALREGALDFVATDHAPHEPGKKTEDFSNAAFGTTGLETALRVLINLYQKGEISAQRVVDVFATKPAEFLRMHDQFGTLKEGRPLYAVLLDVKAKPTPIGLGDLESQSKNNCFLGSQLGGRLLTVFQPGRAWEL